MALEREFSNFCMADVGNKPENFRKAIASGILSCGEKAFTLLTERKLPKGDAFTVAEIAGIMATKNTPALIPLCHPLEILTAHVRFEPRPSTFEVKVSCEVSAIARTGVEMEALTGVTAALLSLYDLIKPVEPALELHSIILEIKEGGKSGLWKREAYLQEKETVKETGKEKGAQAQSHGNAQHAHKHEPEINPFAGLKFGVITISDSCFAKKAEDLSGPTLIENVKKYGGEPLFSNCVPDDVAEISTAIRKAIAAHTQVILLTGGTGLGPRDVTPEALKQLGGKEVLGIGEFLRQDGAKYTSNSWLSRSLAITYQNALIIAFPGKPAACTQGITALVSLIKHAISMMNSEKHADDIRRNQK